MRLKIIITETSTTLQALFFSQTVCGSYYSRIGDGIENGQGLIGSEEILYNLLLNFSHDIN